MSDGSWGAQDIGKEIDSLSWVRDFISDRQAEADYLSMSFFDYMSRVEGGMLSGVMNKLKLHGEDHPDKCPPDCVFMASLEQLKKKYKSDNQ